VHAVDVVDGDLTTRAGNRAVVDEEVLLAPQAVKRLLDAAEVADVAAFLLGPAGRSFTGAPVVLDLGWTAR
jgi:3-hydroxybutyrate dehydrogenase